MSPTIHVADHDIKVSKLDKELFPDDHFSKGDMLLHYIAVAEAMLPHLAGRPLTLRRYPEGIETAGFFQKDASNYFPEWITTVEVAHRHSEGTVHYVVCEDAATLLYLANLATIEFHVWTATMDKLDCPDRLVMDLDPPPGVTVATIRSVARRARDLYTEIGLTPFLQATGGRGYHVVAPLDRSADFRFVRDLAGDIADHLAADDPELLTTAQRKQKRGNRIYLDMNRNGRGQTFVAPYSLRARPGAAVATPLDWGELAKSTPNGFSPAAISRRLAQKTDPWADIDEHATAPATARKRLDAMDRQSTKADLPSSGACCPGPAIPSRATGIRSTVGIAARMLSNRGGVTHVVRYPQCSFDEEAEPMAPNAEYGLKIDVSKPTIARVYDALLGGKDNFAADREAAAAYLKYVPNVGDCAKENRQALIKGVRFMARQGIDQFLDIGAGLPTMENTHQVAQSVNPDAKVVYADNDPIVLSHGRALLATNKSTTVLKADLRDPQDILDHPEVKEMLDFTRPIGLMVVGLHMHFHDREGADEWVRILLDACPSGSYLFITDFVDTGEPLQKGLEQAGLETLGNGWIRTPERITEHFLGLPLIPPGLDFLARWFPSEPDKELTPAEDLEPWQRIMVAGIAYKA